MNSNACMKGLYDLLVAKLAVVPDIIEAECNVRVSLKCEKQADRMYLFVLVPDLELAEQIIRPIRAVIRCLVNEYAPYVQIVHAAERKIPCKGQAADTMVYLTMLSWEKEPQK